MFYNKYLILSKPISVLSVLYNCIYREMVYIYIWHAPLVDLEPEPEPGGVAWSDVTCW